MLDVTPSAPTALTVNLGDFLGCVFEKKNRRPRTQLEPRTLDVAD